ncbi:MAG: B-box zinc finger protein [Terracidiphilus sp.]
MDCVNHNGRVAVYYCQNCGKPLCLECTVSGALGHGAKGQVLCKDCGAAWQQSYQPATPPSVKPDSSFAGIPVPSGPSKPNPVAAAFLGLIPGVGAMYNGQFFKGFIHVVVFAVLISIAESYPIFGVFIAAWIFYQAFEAYHTAAALRDGQPVPDPFGLNEVGNWLNIGSYLRNSSQRGTGQNTGGTPASGNPPIVEGQPLPPNQQPPQPGPYSTPVQFLPVVCWGNKAPVGAIVLIVLGLMFLVGEVRYTFPLILIALGVWLIVRRLGDGQGGDR